MRWINLFSIVHLAICLPRWTSFIDYFYFFIGITSSFSVESFCVEGIRERIQSSTQSSRISPGISPQSSSPPLKIDSNSIELVDTTNSINESIDENFSCKTPFIDHLQTEKRDLLSLDSVFQIEYLTSSGIELNSSSPNESLTSWSR